MGVMKIEIVNNHVIGEVDTNLGTKRCMVDTGSPITFFFDGAVGQYSIDGEFYEITPFSRILRPALPGRDGVERLVGTAIDGFIGSDRMVESGDVLIDFPGGTMAFGIGRPAHGRLLPMEPVMGVPTFGVAIGGRGMRAALDTGAMYSFLGSHMAREIGLAPAHRTIEDFHPGHGSFEAGLHETGVSVLGMDLGVHEVGTAGHYDTVLGMMGVEAFIGVEALTSTRLFLSYATGEASIW